MLRGLSTKKKREIVLSVDVPISNELNHDLKMAIRAIADLVIDSDYFTVLNTDES